MFKVKAQRIAKIRNESLVVPTTQLARRFLPTQSELAQSVGMFCDLLRKKDNGVLTPDEKKQLEECEEILVKEKELVTSLFDKLTYEQSLRLLKQLCIINNSRSSFGQNQKQADLKADALISMKLATVEEFRSSLQNIHTEHLSVIKSDLKTLYKEQTSLKEEFQKLKSAQQQLEKDFAQELKSIKKRLRTANRHTWSREQQERIKMHQNQVQQTAESLLSDLLEIPMRFIVPEFKSLQSALSPEQWIYIDRVRQQASHAFLNQDTVALFEQARLLGPWKEASFVPSFLLAGAHSLQEPLNIERIAVPLAEGAGRSLGQKLSKQLKQEARRFEGYVKGEAPPLFTNFIQETKKAPKPPKTPTAPPITRKPAQQSSSGNIGLKTPTAPPFRPPKTTASGKPARKQTVLLLDSQVTRGDSLEQGLTSRGFHVFRCTQIHEALTRMHILKPDAFVFDWRDDRLPLYEQVPAIIKKDKATLCIAISDTVPNELRPSDQVINPSLAPKDLAASIALSLSAQRSASLEQKPPLPLSPRPTPPASPRVRTRQVLQQPKETSQKHWPLNANNTIIGSGPAAHIRLDDEKISRIHAMIQLDRDNTFLSDLGWSDQGTFLNGQKIQEEKELSKGDIITIGNSKLQITESSEGLMQLSVYDGTKPPSHTDMDQEIEPIHIKIITKEGDHSEVQFAKQELIIGRISSSDISLPKNNVSKRHAKLSYHKGDWELKDLGSTNGTFLNGLRIDKIHKLSPNDQFIIGDFLLQIAFASPQPLPFDTNEELESIASTPKSTIKTNPPSSSAELSKAITSRAQEAISKHLKENKTTYFFGLSPSQQAPTLYYVYPHVLQDVSLYIQLHRMPSYPLLIIHLVLHDQSSQGANDVMLTCPIDFQENETRITLDMLMEYFCLNLCFLNAEYKVYRELQVERPLEENLKYLIQQANIWKNTVPPTSQSYKRAITEYNADGYERFGKMEHPFSKDSFSDLDKPDDVLFANGVTSFWSEPKNYDYLINMRSFPISFFNNIRERVVKKSLRYGIYMNEELRDVAIQSELSNSQTEVIKTLANQFAKTAKKSNQEDGLTAENALINWQQILEAADEYQFKVEHSLIWG